MCWGIIIVITGIAPGVQVTPSPALLSVAITLTVVLTPNPNPDPQLLILLLPPTGDFLQVVSDCNPKIQKRTVTYVRIADTNTTCYPNPATMPPSPVLIDCAYVYAGSNPEISSTLSLIFAYVLYPCSSLDTPFGTPLLMYISSDPPLLMYIYPLTHLCICTLYIF